MSPRSVNILFLALIAGLPLGQAAWELARGGSVQALEVVGPLRSQRLRAFEDDLRRASVVHRFVTPWYQRALLAVFHRGNEQVIPGRAGTLHYAADLDYLDGPDFTASSSAPLECIVDVQRQLEAVGVELLVVPVPPKTSAQGAAFSRWTADRDWLDNPGATAFYDGLARAGVDVLRVDRVLQQSGLGADGFLARDTHWSPRGVASVADELARDLAARLGVERRALLEPVTEPLVADGDLVAMLRLPPGAAPFEPMVVDVPLVPLRFAEFAADAPVLLLGDSSTRVYSDPALGLGAGAGLAELVAQRLGQPIDRIALAGGGARGVREALARRAGLPASAGGLAGKRVVVWQFSMRDLAADDDRWAPLDLGAAAPTAAPAARGPRRLTVRARLVEKSAVAPEFDYAFCLGVYEYELLAGVDGVDGLAAADRLWVAHPIVAERAATDAAALAVGAVLELDLEDLARHHDLEQTAWIDDTAAPARATLWFPTGYRRVER